MKSDEQIKTILETGMRYACFKLSLNKNRKKGGVGCYSYARLIELLKREMEELEEAIKALSKYTPVPWVDPEWVDPDELLEQIAKECGDVIAFASFIAQKTELHGIE